MSCIKNYLLSIGHVRILIKVRNSYFHWYVCVPSWQQHYFNRTNTYFYYSSCNDIEDFNVNCTLYMIGFIYSRSANMTKRNKYVNLHLKNRNNTFSCQRLPNITHWCWIYIVSFIWDAVMFGYHISRCIGLFFILIRHKSAIAIVQFNHKSPSFLLNWWK